MSAPEYINKAIDIAIKLGLLMLLVGWCLLILNPFLIPVIWAVVIAVTTNPVYCWFRKKTGGKSKLAATIITFILLAFVLIPGILFIKSAIEGVTELGSLFTKGLLSIPPPREEIKDWPLVGAKLYDSWILASENLQNILFQYKDQLIIAGQFLFDSISGTGMGLIQMLLSIIIAGILLATEGTRNFTSLLFNKVAGSFGNEFADIAEQTIRSVVKGILGVALIQSALFAVGFVLADIPYAGLWALIVLILAIVQLPPLLVVIPIIIYLFGIMSPIGASLWAICFMLIGLSDNILKPILLGKGASVPMLVIFLGSIGGFIAFGFIGLFLGAVILSLGYKLLLAWLEVDTIKSF